MHRGPRPHYRDEHMVYLMLMLRIRGRMSRGRISECLDIGEGSVRSMLSHLISAGKLAVTRRGVELSDSGRDFVDGLGLQVVPLGINEDKGIAVSAAVVKGAADSVGDGIAQVFSAIRAGADDVLVCRVDGNVVPVYSYAPDFESGMDASGVRDTDEGDAVIVCGSEDELGANLAAVAAGFGLRRSGQGMCI